MNEPRHLDADPRTPEHGLDPQHQLGNGKGLADIVIRAQGEALDDVLVAGFGREHDDGLVPVGVADFVADLKAVHPRQHDVQQDQVEFAAERLVAALPAIARAVHRIAVEDKNVHQTRADRLLVLDYQYAQFPLHPAVRLHPNCS